LKTVTIRDIAKRAGVVPSTVSVVLNGKAKEMRISDLLSERIKVIAKEMGYHPNQTAVSLRTGRSRILGLIVEDISNVFFASLARSIEDEADALGYNVVYCSTENNDAKGRELVKMLLHRQVDGFLITPTNGMRQEVKKLSEQGRPLVLMDRYFPGLEVPCVMTDNYIGIETAMNHLIEKGYSRIGFVTVDLDQVQMQQREKAYLQTMAAGGAEEPSRLVLKIPYKCKQELAVDAIKNFINKFPELEALVFSTNYLGIYGLDSFKQLEIPIPRGLAMICFDDHDIFRLHTPEITIIEQPIHEIAKLSVQFLLRQIGSNQFNIKELQSFEKPRMVLRAST
jgi:LacI family transcriptional regulator